MAEHSLHLRPARADDAALLLAWRNDPDTRRNSLRPHEIAPEDHERWFRARLSASSQTCIFIAELDGAPVGQARVDRREGREGEISVGLAPDARGHGIGRKLIAAASRMAAAELGLDQLVALVKPANTASLRAFEAAGYEDGGEVERDGALVRRLRWRSVDP